MQNCCATLVDNWSARTRRQKIVDAGGDLELETGEEDTLTVERHTNGNRGGLRRGQVVGTGEVWGMRCQYLSIEAAHEFCHQPTTKDTQTPPDD